MIETCARVGIASVLGVLALAGAGCVGQSQSAAPEAPVAQSGEAAPTTSSKLARCPGLTVPAVDGLLDDFEDGNNQLTPMDTRDGYWWVSKDSLGSKVSEPAEGFQPAEGGAAGSSMAAHVKGHTVTGGDQAYGVEFGVNFLAGKGMPYDASKYAGVSFKAKAGPGARSVRFSVADVNTHPDGQKCKSCWNHFRKDLNLTGDWKEYRVLFTEMQQRPGWGDPRPEHVTPSQVLALSFAVGGAEADFEIWVDDLQFLECKKQE